MREEEGRRAMDDEWQGKVSLVWPYFLSPFCVVMVEAHVVATNNS